MFATASVPRSTLEDGREVVVKVQHDGIKEIILEVALKGFSKTQLRLRKGHVEAAPSIVVLLDIEKKSLQSRLCTTSRACQELVAKDLHGTE